MASVDATSSEAQREFEADKLNKTLALEWEKLEVERERIKLEEKVLKVRELEAKVALAGHKVRLAELEANRRGFQPAVEPPRAYSVGRPRDDDAGPFLYHPSPTPEPIPVSNVTIWPEDEASMRVLHR
jgi:hypothetical protein